MQKAAYFDTSAFMDVLRGESGVLATVETFREFYTGAHVAAQLMGSEAALLERGTVKKSRAPGILGAVDILPFTEADAEKAGELIGKLKEDGKDVGLDEAMIAAQCTRRGLTLVTRRKQFRDFKKQGGLSLKEV